MASLTLEKGSSIGEHETVQSQEATHPEVSPVQEDIPDNYFWSARFVGTVLAAGTSLFAVCLAYC